ncbi:MAG: hypothetical protein A2X05_10430 [Bacteroidetes bacterium GWE2_41_25]|nr:MAG: hypothetical protein A2X03_08145 [Bacteroidetes bacterium GWA2_40_15]OFY12917.1 MAG: hypothetical protein A2X05_10430 [Bacteroidetes bacterium GWE2_41_25]HAM09706.1 hypothetical protein [Bacteroidales bacterium]HBQ82453.1 hypothetical protein [Bacteroidales bacterium]HCU20604.1 hypothetical protein [Bacteroidales bacterium]
MFCKITLRFSLFLLFLTISSFSITEAKAFKSIEEAKKAEFTVKETTKDILISNGIIELKFYEEKSGFGLKGIKNVQKDHDFMMEQPDKSIIWEIEFKHTSNRLVTIDNKVRCNRTYSIEKSGDGSKLTLHLYWKNIPLDNEDQAFDVHATVSLDGSSLSYWQINIENRSKRFGTWEITYPLIKGLRASEDEDVQLAFSDFSGRLLKNPVKRIPELLTDDPRPPQIMSYPSARCTMQYSTLFEGKNNNGLYFATHDSKAYVKKFGYDVDEENRSLTYGIKNYPEGMGFPGSESSYTMPYEVVIGVYEGDWITASKIYRNWAINQKWCLKGTLSKRTDIPKWYLNTIIWFAGGPSDNMIPLAKYLDVPTAFQWYNWHQIPFDTYYPDYFPPVTEFSEKAKQLQSAGIKITPYINSRIWDMNSKSWISENPQTAACKVPYTLFDDLISYSRWPSHVWRDLTISMSHWNGNPFAVMCPTTKVWQDKQSEIITRLVSEYGMNGVYMDQTASCQPVYCFDPTHGHHIGGGNYWVEGNRKMVEICKENARKKNPEIILTTEDFAEPFIDVFDGLLACNTSSIAPELIPMFNYVYSGYCLRFGRSNSNSGLPFMMRNAQMFLWGEQMGWFDPDIVELESPEAKYIKVLCKALDKKEIKKFLFYGEMVRPPKLVGDTTVLSAAWSKNQEDTEMPAVSHSAWKAEDGTLGLVFTNLDNSAHTISYTVDSKQYNLPQTKKYDVKVIDGVGAGKIKRYNSSSFTRTEKIPARSVLVLEIKAGDR